MGLADAFAGLKEVLFECPGCQNQFSQKDIVQIKSVTEGQVHQKIGQWLCMGCANERLDGQLELRPDGQPSSA